MKALFSVLALAALTAACGGDDAPPPIPVPDAASDAPRRPVGLDQDCSLAVCMEPYTCTTTTATMRCAEACTTDADCDADHRCAGLVEGRFCTLTPEAPACVIAPPYRVANLDGLAVDVRLELGDLWDVMVTPETPLTLSNTGAISGPDRQNIRYEVWPQDGVGEEEDELVNVFIMRSLTVTEGATLTLDGNRPVILLVKEEVTIDGSILPAEDSTPPGGAPAVSAAGGGVGNGLGGGLFESGQGGGGASHCSAGGAGGDMTLDPLVAPTYGDGTNEPLRGGSSGAGVGVFSGAGGAALQISGGVVVIGATGRIDMSGLDDARFEAEIGDDGGGGGSGGAILLQGNTVTVNGTLTAEGGTGGTGQALTGGAGATGNEPAVAGTLGSGGGGGFGYIRVVAGTADISMTAALSPARDNDCLTEAGPDPAVGAADPPPACGFSVGEPAAERCETCNQRYCCDALTACDEDPVCGACRVDPTGPACGDDMLLREFANCLRRVCFTACLPVIASFPMGI